MEKSEVMNKIIERYKSLVSLLMKGADPNTTVIKGYFQSIDELEEQLNSNELVIRDYQLDFTKADVELFNTTLELWGRDQIVICVEELLS